MRDISGRLRRRRLSRFAPPDDPIRRRLHWAWWGLALWLLWACVLSDHSFYRLWQTRLEGERVAAELEATRHEVERLDRELEDEAAARGLAERVLRERNGMARPGEIVYRIRPERDSLPR